MCVLSINVMLFDHFRCHFAILAPKVFIFDRFYKGFRNAFLHFEKPHFHWFYKVFRRFGNVSRKPSLGNAFSIILRANFEKGAPKSSFLTSFIRYFYQLFRMLQDVVLLKVFGVLRSRKTAPCSCCRPSSDPVSGFLGPGQNN